MIIISDTNILSSLAAAAAFPLLFQIFPNAKLCIPPGVEQELQAGLHRNQAHLDAVLQAVMDGRLSVLPLSSAETALAQNLPKKLNTGECEAIALAKSRQAPLLSNDKRAIRYCRQNKIDVLDLTTILNLLWTKQIVTKKRVEAMIQRMADTEGLALTDVQRQRVFASRSRRRRKS